MVNRSAVVVLVQGLSLLLFHPACDASSLGMSVHVAPLESTGGKTVVAHFTAVLPGPCLDVSGVCSSGEDCLVQSYSVPYTGSLPSPGWCVRRWQSAVPSHYSDLLLLGPSTQLYVSMNAEPNIRGYNGKLNRPAFAALPPPFRARVNCSRLFQLTVKDPDGDKVRCRFARPNLGECRDCVQHSFIDLDEESCLLRFTGEAAAGRYFIHLMVEDFIPLPKTRYLVNNPPLSSVPLHLSLTVEESDTSCSEAPLASDETPKDQSELPVLPFQEVRFTIIYMSRLESVSEIAVIGSVELYRFGFTSVGPFTKLTVSWVRSDNATLTPLLPVCFVANTQSLQSEPRCVWLYQRELSKLPPGTELKCDDAEMSLLLPLASLADVNLAELQLNSPSCPVDYNSTHLTAHISLSGCGTQTVHAGSDLVYTNTLRSVRPYTVVNRRPSLLFPLACRIPAAQVQGPHHSIDLPTESETFGDFRFWMEFYPPGEGPLAQFTSRPTFRSNPLFESRARREAESERENTTVHLSTHPDSDSMPVASGDRFRFLDLHVMSDCQVERSELIVSSCLDSETMDFERSQRFLDKGCPMSADFSEIEVPQGNTKIYRLDLNRMAINGTMMYVQCVVNLCMSTVPSAACPDLCRGIQVQMPLVNSVFTNSYTVRSGPVSLVRTSTTAPTTAAPTTTTAATTAEPVTPGSHATEQTSSMTTGFLVTVIGMFFCGIY
ncbi:uncharacterized protein LOC115400563 [Salarias fasciatus]|uniref:uncharacterized protein LOC115400563 n=1 Tax=Salarias fasciatus TaxID=181472 RepID=UPI0011769550|nr:uncharacterized protein LOC115400563 [Salarias fasciatus]XP_029964516.1 uncharacterized protein LOC115400563 [Salarias fasciatus]XP_029964583.1 uncharacterized protein LOC115400563 [Salarias fasciatus]